MFAFPIILQLSGNLIYSFIIPPQIVTVGAVCIHRLKILKICLIWIVQEHEEISNLYSGHVRILKIFIQVIFQSALVYNH